MNSISNSGNNLLYYKDRSPHFIAMKDMISTMQAMRIPAVFSFKKPIPADRTMSDGCLCHDVAHGAASSTQSWKRRHM